MIKSKEKMKMKIKFSIGSVKKLNTGSKETLIIWQPAQFPDIKNTEISELTQTNILLFKETMQIKLC